MLSDVSAHEFRPAYFGLTEVRNNVFDVIWKQPRQADKRLRIEPILPRSCRATQAVTEEFTAGAILRTWQVLCNEHAFLEEPLRFDGLSATLTDVWIDFRSIQTEARFSALARAAKPEVWLGSVKAYSLTSYFGLGTRHLLSGLDHILLILALLLFTTRFTTLVKTITAFTVAHSISLAASTLELVHVPANAVEGAIALSILFLAVEASSADKRQSISARMPWAVAFACGLLHGLGFAGALQAIGLPTGYVAEALLLFNLGIEFAQVLLIATILLLVTLVETLRRPNSMPPWLVHLPVYAIGTVSSYWLFQRVAISVAG
jgi:hydrogenase/urease accessory protein HupE